MFGAQRRSPRDVDLSGERKIKRLREEARRSLVVERCVILRAISDAAGDRPPVSPSDPGSPHQRKLAVVTGGAGRRPASMRS
jgi:hypothetical protein